MRYNKPKTITEGGADIKFAYGANRSRYKQVNGGTTILYVDGLYERESTSTATTHVHYIVAGGEAVAIYKSASNSVQSTRYLHRDHLGSIAYLTNEAGGVAETFSYDAWGKRRKTDWTGFGGFVGGYAAARSGSPPSLGQRQWSLHTFTFTAIVPSHSFGGGVAGSGNPGLPARGASRVFHACRADQ